MMTRKSKIDEDCEELSVAADPWNLKLKSAKLKSDPFLSPKRQLPAIGGKNWTGQNLLVYKRYHNPGAHRMGIR